MGQRLEQEGIAEGREAAATKDWQSGAHGRIAHRLACKEVRNCVPCLGLRSYLQPECIQGLT